MAGEAGRSRHVMTVDLGHGYAMLLQRLVQEVRRDAREGRRSSGLMATRSDVLRMALDSLAGIVRRAGPSEGELAAYLAARLSRWWEQDGGDTKKGRRTTAAKDRAICEALAGALLEGYQVGYRPLVEPIESKGVGNGQGEIPGGGGGDATDPGSVS